MLPVRVFFKKKGPVSYISHLDLQRAVNRGIVRSGLKAVYTEGFNPHIKLAFAMPLSLFQESDYEMFDFFVADDCDYDFIKEKLRKAFPPDIEIIAAAAPVKKASALYSADYEMTLSGCTEKELDEIFSGEIRVMKRSKKGMTETDLSPLVFHRQILPCKDGLRLEINAACNSVSYLNIGYLAAFFEEKGIETISMKRCMMYDKNKEKLV